MQAVAVAPVTTGRFIPIGGGQRVRLERVVGRSYSSQGESNMKFVRFNSLPSCSRASGSQVLIQDRIRASKINSFSIFTADFFPSLHDVQKDAEYRQTKSR